MRYNPHKRTFANHRVCSWQFFVRVVNDLLIRNVSRFSTKISSMRYNPHKRTFENHWSHWFIGKKISFKPTLQRRNEIIAALKECQIRKQMRPREASAFLGRLNFLLSTSYTSVGRAATQPLVDRASNRHEGNGPSRANKNWWTHSMTHMLNFFEQLFAHLPPLFLTSTVISARKWYLTSPKSIPLTMRHQSAILSETGTIFDEYVNQLVMPVLIGSCWCGMTPPLIHGSSADGTKRRFGARRTSTR